MASIPQLRKDIAALQADNKALRAEVVALRNAPKPEPKIVVKEVIKSVREVVYVDREVIKHVKCPKQAALIAQLRGNA